MSLISKVLESLDPDNSYILNYLKGASPMDQAAVATSMIPGVGDVLGVSADVSNMIQNPDQRTLANALWLAAGAAPFIPSRSQVAPIRAYHGSPHDFDKFSMNAIGTGEGAQAFGHGLYFAESEDVARGYRKKFAKGNQISVPGVPPEVNRFLNQELRQTDYGSADEIDPDWFDFMADELDALGETAGARALRNADTSDPSKWSGAHMYAVDIHASPDEFLDLDVLLDEQPAHIKEVLESADMEQTIDGAYDFAERYDSNPTGRHLLEYLNEEGPDWAADMLNAKGVKGTRYKDGFSRGSEGGTSNYVVFDEDIISIAKKYGLPPVIVAGMLQARDDERSNPIVEF